VEGSQLLLSRTDGEFERNDMVEYFGEQLDGFAFSQFGWVQSYGSRYVKPPIIFGDVSRPEAMTVDWFVFARNHTEKQVKGMVLIKTKSDLIDSIFQLVDLR